LFSYNNFRYSSSFRRGWIRHRRASEASSLRKKPSQDSFCDINERQTSLDSCCANPRTMPPKLSSRQQAQLAYLEQLPPKFQRMHNVIEQMASLRVDDAILRGFARLLDEIKGNAGALSLSGLAETAGIMGTMLRRGGGLQFKVRGLRELLGSLKSNYDAALREATTPQAPDVPDAPG
jgi:hypothetical protein